MKEYEIDFTLNGQPNTFYITPTQANYSNVELRASLIHHTKTHFKVRNEDEFEVISISPDL